MKKLFCILISVQLCFGQMTNDNAPRTIKGTQYITTPETFGAVGDCSTNDSTAINAAIADASTRAAASSGAAIVQFAAKCYAFTFLTPITQSGVSLIGSTGGPGGSASIAGITLLKSTDTTHTLISLVGITPGCVSGSIWMNRIENIAIGRTAQASGGNGISVVNGCWVTLKNIESDDSLSDFYINGSAVTLINRVQGGWQNSNATAANVLEIDSSSSTSNPSTYVKFLAAYQAAGSTNKTGVYVHGDLIADTYLDDITTAATAHGITITSTSHPAGDSYFNDDIHITNAVLDRCSVNCISVNNLYGGGTSRVYINGGFADVLTNGIAIDLESTQGVSVNNFQIHGEQSGSIGIKIAGANSSNNQLIGNSLDDVASGLSIATPYNVISNNNFNSVTGVTGTMISLLSGATNNILTGNILTGFATTGMSLASGANSNIALPNEINPANISTPISDGGTSNLTTGFSGSKTAGACTLTILNGTITAVSGC